MALSLENYLSEVPVHRIGTSLTHTGTYIHLGQISFE